MLLLHCGRAFIRSLPPKLIKTVILSLLVITNTKGRYFYYDVSKYVIFCYSELFRHYRQNVSYHRDPNLYS